MVLYALALLETVLLLLHKNSVKRMFYIITGIDYIFTPLNTLRENKLKEKHSEFEMDMQSRVKIKVKQAFAQQVVFRKKKSTQPSMKQMRYLSLSEVRKCICFIHPFFFQAYKTFLCDRKAVKQKANKFRNTE